MKTIDTPNGSFFDATNVFGELVRIFNASGHGDYNVGFVISHRLLLGTTANNVQYVDFDRKVAISFNWRRKVANILYGTAESFFASIAEMGIKK